MLKPPLNVAGQSLNDEQMDKVLLFSMVYAGLPIAVFASTLIEHFKSSNHWLSLVFSLSVSAIIYVTALFTHGRKLVHQIRNLRIGYHGEVAVGQELEKTRYDRYGVYHDIINAKPAFNIDHVIIGEAGVIVFETKAKSKPLKGDCKVKINSGKLEFSDGVVTDAPLDQARRNVEYIQALIQGLVNDSMKGALNGFTNTNPVPVSSCVVYPGWHADYMSAVNHDVKLTNEKMVCNFVAAQHKRNKVLTHQQAYAINELFEQYLRKQKEHLVER